MFIFLSLFIKQILQNTRTHKMYLPGFEVHCIAIISIEEADRLTYAGTPPSLRVEPTLKIKKHQFIEINVNAYIKVPLSNNIYCMS